MTTATITIGARVRIICDESGEAPESVGLAGVVTALIPALHYSVVVQIDLNDLRPGVDDSYHCHPAELELL